MTEILELLFLDVPGMFVYLLVLVLGGLVHGWTL